MCYSLDKGKGVTITAGRENRRDHSSLPPPVTFRIVLRTIRNRNYKELRNYKEFKFIQNSFLSFGTHMI